MTRMDRVADFPPEYIRPYILGINLLERSKIFLFHSNQKSEFQRTWPLIFIIPCSLTFTATVLLNFYKLLAESADLVEIANEFNIVCILIQCIFKAMVIVPNRKKLGAVIEDLANIWPKDEDLSTDQIVIKNMHLKRLDICNSVFYWCNIGGSWQYMLTPFSEVLIRRLFGVGDAKRVLPFGGAFPFDPSSSWQLYCSAYLFQIFGIIKLIYCLLGPELLMISLCAHLSTLFTLLRDDLLNMKSRRATKNGSLDISMKDGYKGNQGFKSIVKRHQTLIMLCNTADEIFNKIIFVDLLFATITTCFFAIVAKLSKSPGETAKNLVGVFATLLPIFNLCYYGQLLIDASTGLIGSAYSSQWYKGDVKYQKMLFFVMMRCLKPCCLTSLRYSPVALKSFTTVMSTTWSYFSLASTVIQDKK